MFVLSKLLYIFSILKKHQNKFLNISILSIGIFKTIFVLSIGILKNLFWYFFNFIILFFCFMVILVFILGPVGSGRDRKNEEKITKYESDLVLVETIKRKSGLFNLQYFITYYYFFNLN